MTDLTQKLSNFLFQLLQSTAELSWTLVAYLTIDQKLRRHGMTNKKTKAKTCTHKKTETETNPVKIVDKKNF